jgi:hypothetical protein
MACCPVCGKKIKFRRLHSLSRADYIFCGSCDTRLVINRKSQVKVYVFIIIITTLPCMLFDNDMLCYIGGIFMLFLLLISDNFVRLDKKE